MTDTAVDAERDRIRALRALGVLDAPPDQHLDSLVRIAQQLFNVPMASLTLVDAHRQWRASWAGPLTQEAPLRGSLCATAMRSAETFVRTDLGADPDFADNPFVTGDEGLRFYAGAPIHAPSGEPIGTLCVMDTAPRAITDGQRSALADLARRAEQELARATEHQQVAQLQRQLLPQRAPDVAGYAFAGLYAPARGLVGSDFYDWHLVPGGVQFAVADVLGTGLAAAVVAASARAALRTTALASDPAEHLEGAGQLLVSDLRELGIELALFLGRIDPASGTLSFVDAGACLALLVRRDGRWERLGADGPALGAGQPRWRTRTVVLEPGDTVVCGTPTLTWAGDPAVTAATIAATVSTSSFAELEERMTTLELNHEGPADLTAVVVRRLDG